MAWRGRIRRATHLLLAGAGASGIGVCAGLGAGADIELGRHLASECMTCHRSAAVGGQIPNIFGLPSDRLTVLLAAYREKKLSNPVMQNIAGRLNDDEIASLALFFSVNKRP